MTSKPKYKKLFTEDEIQVERVFEIMIRDIRERGEKKKVSFSVMAEKGIRDDQYPDADEMREILKMAIKRGTKKYG